MRLLIFVSLLFLLPVAAEAQNVLPVNNFDYPSGRSIADSAFTSNNFTSAKKWSVTKYAGFSTGIGFFNGGSATMFAMPVGLQLNRRLTNNWYAFAGISAAPVYTNFNSSFLSSYSNKSLQNNPGFNSNNLALYSRAELGLMYVNDQKTFSISGSIGIERSNYPSGSFSQIGAARPSSFSTYRKPVLP